MLPSECLGYLNETMQREITRHNSRLDKLSESQDKRRQLLEAELGDLERWVDDGITWRQRGLQLLDPEV